VPELGDVGDPHDPSPDDRDRVGYPMPVVDHAAERLEALARWEEIR
jgi:deoxyribodipyrimidine photo-lyase